MRRGRECHEKRGKGVIKGYLLIDKGDEDRSEK